MDIPFDAANIAVTVAGLIVAVKYIDRRLGKVEANQGKLAIAAARREERQEWLIREVREIKAVTNQCPLAHAVAGIKGEANAPSNG